LDAAKVQEDRAGPEQGAQHDTRQVPRLWSEAATAIECHQHQKRAAEAEERDLRRRHLPSRHANAHGHRAKKD
jgi:hypothetical protein